MLKRLIALLAILPMALAALFVPTAASAHGNDNGNGNGNGNNGTVKIAEDGDFGTPSHDPHVGCTFTVEWYGFDKGSNIVSNVSFAMQAPTGDVALTVKGNTRVFVGGDDSSGGGSAAGLDGREAYTLSFKGASHPQQGYHVKVTINTPGSQGADNKSKVIWVTGCDQAPAPAPGLALTKTVNDSNDADTLASQGETLTYGFSVTNTGNVPLTNVKVTDAMIPALANGALCATTLAAGATTDCSSLPAATHVTTVADTAHGSVDNTATALGTPPTGSNVSDQDSATIETLEDAEQPPTSTPGPFDWNWTYEDPSCNALSVEYPSNIPDGQANDVNVRIQTNLGEVTLNFHNNEGFWSGHTGFDYSSHPGWPVDVTSYSVVWTQVAGTNYHWKGNVRCLLNDDGDPTTDDSPVGVTTIDGFRTGTMKVHKGDSVSDVVSVSQLGSADLTLQTLSRGSARGARHWHDVRTIATHGSTVRVNFGRQKHKGKFKYRLAAAASDGFTGATTRTFTIRVK